MIRFVDEMATLESVDSLPEKFWLSDFRLYAEKERFVPDQNFTERMDRFLSTEPFKTKFGRDIVRNSEKIVTASRVPIQYVNVSVDDSRAQIDILHRQYSVAAMQPMNQGLNADEWYMFSFGEVYYPWELLGVIIHEILLMLMVGLASVFTVALLFIEDPMGALVVTSIVAMIYVELVGFLYIVGVTINPVSVVGLTMSVRCLRWMWNI